LALPTPPTQAEPVSVRFSRLMSASVKVRAIFTVSVPSPPASVILSDSESST
jgi:hypothetical protein